MRKKIFLFILFFILIMQLNGEENYNFVGFKNHNFQTDEIPYREYIISYKNKEFKCEIFNVFGQKLVKFIIDDSIIEGTINNSFGGSYNLNFNSGNYKIIGKITGNNKWEININEKKLTGKITSKFGGLKEISLNYDKISILGKFDYIFGEGYKYELKFGERNLNGTILYEGGENPIKMFADNLTKEEIIIFFIIDFIIHDQIDRQKDL